MEEQNKLLGEDLLFPLIVEKILKIDPACLELKCLLMELKILYKLIKNSQNLFPKQLIINIWVLQSHQVVLVLLTTCLFFKLLYQGKEMRNKLNGGKKKQLNLKLLELMLKQNQAMVVTLEDYKQQQLMIKAHKNLFQILRRFNQ